MQRMLMLSAVLAIAVGTSVAATKAEPPRGLTRLVVQVDGLACPFCAYGVEKKLKTLPNVDKVEVELKSGKVTVTFRRPSDVRVARVQKLVRDAGFSPRSVTLSAVGTVEPWRDMHALRIGTDKNALFLLMRDMHTEEATDQVAPIVRMAGDGKSLVEVTGTYDDHGHAASSERDAVPPALLVKSHRMLPRGGTR